MHSLRFRILSIIPYKILPAKLGGEKGIAVFNEYLAKNADLIGISTINNDPALAKGYRLLNILSNNRSRYMNLFLITHIKKIIRKQNVTHLITEHPYYGWLASILRKATGVTWIVHSHNIEYMRSMSIGRWWWKALKAYESWAYKNADKVFFISDDDRKHAIEYLGVNPAKSLTVTYGIEQDSIPPDREECKKIIREKYSISGHHKILLFNGALYHSTNYDALSIILEKINPLLIGANTFLYKIIVCGKGLPGVFNELKDYTDKNIIYAGFVDDISMYFKAADIFLNPISSGGGVKTKAIEAIAMDCTVISTRLGAMGIKKEVCGNKIKVVNEGEWELFRDLIISSSNENDHTPEDFFKYYNWNKIIDRAMNFISHSDKELKDFIKERPV
ncbi:MAG TPA: glycosyltransferase family 4 protein [Flavitalea sp.]|nr:glycosyltransferase family 4 protein [Flavitalea sp.]